jgi:leucyl/phenylalanyl-tRNA---protein transferase
MSDSEERKINPEDLLDPEIMIRLYASGAFPMAEDRNGSINWYLPNIRTIIPLENFNIPRSLKSSLKKQEFTYKLDTSVIEVVNECQKRERTWISDQLIDAYKKLKKRGFLHSVETWQNNELVGGLYGVAFRGAFFGESMFSKTSQASKASLIKLVEHLRERGFILLDVQYLTPHLQMFGAKEISFEEYKDLLNSAYIINCTF